MITSRSSSTQSVRVMASAALFGAAALLSLPGPVRADLLDDAKNAASRLNNLGDLGRGAAEAAVTQARQQAEQVWALSRAPASQQRAAAEASLADARQKWIEYQQRVGQQAASRGAQLQANLEADFPELARASAATANYGYGFALHEVQMYERAGSSLLNRLVQLDQKYKLSASVRRMHTVDFARDYPEIHALGTSPVCSPLQFTTTLRLHRPRIQEALAQLAAMDRRYQVSATAQQLAAFNPGPLQQQLDNALRQPACQSEVQAAGEAGERDARLLLAYLNELLGRVHGVTSSPVYNQNSGVAARINGEIQALNALIGATAELIAAEAAVRQASKQIDDDREEIGRSGNPGIRSMAEQYRTIASIVTGVATGGFAPSGRAPKSNDDILDTPDTVDKMGRDIEKLNRDYELYRQAAARRNRALFAILPAIADTGNRTADLGRALGASGSPRDANQDALIAMSLRFPALRAPAASGQALLDCVNRQTAAWIQTERMFEDALSGLRAAARQKLAATSNLIPPDVKAQLVAAIRAGNDLSRTMDITDRVVAEAGTAAQAYTGEFSQFAARAAALMGGGNAELMVRELGDLSSGLSPRVNELAERGAAAQQYADQAVAKSRAFALELQNLKRLLAQRGLAGIADLNQLVDSLGLTVELAARPDMQAFAQCALQKRQLYAAVAQNLIRRVAEYIPRRAQALAALATSPAVMQSVDRCIVMAKEFSASGGALVEAVGAAGQRAFEYKNAYAALMAAIVPVPRPDAVQRLQASQERLEALRQAAGVVSQRVTPAQGNLDALANCVNALKTTVLGPQGGPFLEDAASLVFPRVDLAAYPGRLIADGNRIVADLRAIEELGRLWIAAAGAFPGRLAAFTARAGLRAVSAVDPALAQRMEGMLNEGQGFVNGCVNCLNRATANAAAFGAEAVQLAARALGDAMNEAQGAVDGARGRLGALLPPPFGNRAAWRERGCGAFDLRDSQGRCWEPNPPSDDELRGAIGAANAAADAVARVSDNARRRFESLASAQVNRIQSDIGCVGQQANFVLAKANDVRTALNTTVIAPVMAAAQPMVAAGVAAGQNLAAGGMSIAGAAAAAAQPSPACTGNPAQVAECQAKLAAYQAYMANLGREVRLYSLTPGYVQLLQPFYPNVDLRTMQFGYSPRQQKNNATTDCNRTYFNNEQFVQNLAQGDISGMTNGAKWLLHELRHIEQCAEWRSRDAYTLRWFGDFQIAIIQARMQRDPEAFMLEVHDKQPMEADANARATQVLGRLGGNIIVGAPRR